MAARHRRARGPRDSECDGGLMEQKNAGRTEPRFIDRLIADLRAWITAMFLTFGIMLTVYGAFFASAEDLAKGGGINLTLWTGVGMIVTAANFAMWFMARPLEISQASEDETKGDAEA